MGISERIELRHLRAFVAVADTLNFRAAAERLHLSQPPLSRTIAQLEDLLGSRLFDRDRRDVALTRAGAALLPRVRRLLADLPAALRIAPDTAAKRRARPRVGVFFAVNPAAQQRLQRAVQAAHIEVGRTHELLLALRQGKLDAALVMLPAPTTGLAVQPVGRAQMLAALPATHPLARRRRVAVAELDALPALLFLGRRQNAPLYHFLDAALRARGLRTPRYRVPRDTYAGFAQIAAGNAGTLLCEWVRGFVAAGVALVPLRQADRIEVEIGWVTRVPDAAQAAAVAAALRATFARRVRATNHA